MRANMLKGQKLKFLIAFVVVILLALSETLIPGFLARIIDAGIYNTYSHVKWMDEILQLGVVDERSAYIFVYAIYMLMAMVAWSGLNIWLSYLSADFSAGVAHNLRMMMFQKVMTFGKHEMEKFGVTSLITRNTNNINQVQNFLFRLLKYGLFSVFLGIGSIIRVLNSNANMSAVLLVGFSMCIVILVGSTLLTLPSIKKSQKLLDEQNHVFSNTLQGNMNVRSLNTQEIEIKKYEKTNLSIKRVMVYLDNIFSLLFPTLFSISDFMLVAIVYFGSFFIDAGEMSIGALLSFSQYSKQLILAFILIIEFAVMVPRTIVSYNRIKEVLKSDIEIGFVPDESEASWNREALDAQNLLSFDHVSFKYPDAKEYTLKDVNFSLSLGESLGVTGTIGSGKSTLLDLLFRMVERTTGEIKIFGKSINSYSHRHLSRYLSYSPQQSLLLSGTLRNNLCYNFPDADEQHMKKIVDIVQLQDFVEKYGFDRDISQEAKNLSGGQKQRLSIGRCIIRDAFIYVFDDSFSALDTKTDKLVRSALKEYLSNSSMIVVSSRIATIKDMDKILVLDDGNVVGYGKHEELLEHCDIYRQLADSQKSTMDER